MSPDGYFFKPVDLSDPRGQVEARFYAVRQTDETGALAATL